MQAFDSIAASYDKEFTDSAIGQYQRARVWYFMHQILDKKPISKVLELNAGTGQDALRFSERGIPVLCTDISQGMLDVAQQKAQSQNAAHISFRQLSITNLDQLEGQYDLIFSNFGGLNCLSPQQMTELGRQAQRLLSPVGCFVAVVMSRFSCWESLYFRLKRQPEQRRRRKQKIAIKARLDATTFVDTYYYQPQELIELMQQPFKKVQCRSVGYFLPPSYLEPFFVKRPRLLRFLDKLEYLVPAGNLFSGASDHYLLQLEKN